jgi:hypothetical protein
MTRKIFGTFAVLISLSTQAFANGSEKLRVVLIDKIWEKHEESIAFEYEEGARSARLKASGILQVKQRVNTNEEFDTTVQIASKLEEQYCMVPLQGSLSLIVDDRTDIQGFNPGVFTLKSEHTVKAPTSLKIYFIKGLQSRLDSLEVKCIVKN